MSVDYREQLLIERWILLLFVGIVTLISMVLLLQLFLNTSVGTNPAPNYLLFALDIGLVFMLLNFFKLNIQVSSRQLEVRYGLIKKTIPADDIVSCEPTRARLGVYGGIGIRWGTDGSMAFTVSFGKAVKIIRKAGRPFVVSSNNPERLSGAIRSILEQSGRDPCRVSCMRD